MLQIPAFLRTALIALSIGLALGLSAAALAQDTHAPSAAHEAAASHGSHDKGELPPTVSQGLAPAITSIIVFIIVFAILGTQVWPKVVKGLADRTDKIRSEIEAAEMAQLQAKAALTQYEKNLADARAEAQRMLEQTKAEQTALAAQLRAQADADLSAMREKARRDIEAAKRSAVIELHDAASNLATSIAAKILRREISSGDQHQLVQEAIGELSNVSRA
ncbi:MAG: F0F1 ATP synthase subunit B [Phycisphaeraceae bacterium]|nr:F0F1 ATP synthase subunit B [Phycisphaeraceae bacterium]